MFPQEKTSPFAYILAAVLTAALIGGWFLLRRESSAPTPTVASAPDGPVTPGTEPALPPVSANATVADAERFFARWGGYVVWKNDLAEFALWSPTTRDYTQFFEVRRTHGEFTFRRIAQLTRPLIDHGEKANVQMAFTETAEMRDTFYRDHPGFKPTKSAAAANLPPKPPERFSRAPSPRSPIDPVADPVVAERALLAALHAALARAGEKSAQHQSADLLAVLSFHRLDLLAANASPAAIEAAIARRKDLNEGILAASSAFLSPSQLKIYRTELDREVRRLETYRQPPIPPPVTNPR